MLFDSVALPGVALTEKTIPFAEAFTKRFGGAPSYAGYMAYDATHYTAEAVRRAGSTEADKLVDALEKTDWIGHRRGTSRSTARTSRSPTRSSMAPA